jgi:hypothetical protein
MNDAVKYKILAFLIDDLISIEELKKIPLHYMMHVIITTHLVKNDSMTMQEATAMTKTMIPREKREENNLVSIIYPKDANVRAFRIQILYDELFSILTMCLSSIGLKEFIVCFAKSL